MRCRPTNCSKSINMLTAYMSCFRQLKFMKMAKYQSLITILAPNVISLASIVLEKEKRKIKHQLGVTEQPSKCTVNTAVAFSSNNDYFHNKFFRN